MANEVLVKHATPIVWSDTTDYSSTVSGWARTDQLDLSSVGSAGARQGAKKDLQYAATALFPRRWLVAVGIEFATAPNSGETVDIYWAGSPSSTAGKANPSGTSGSDAAYTGTSGDSLADSLLQLQYIGSMVCTADATTAVQYATVGVLETALRYGMPVVYNNTSDALVSDAVEQYVALLPLVDEVQ